MYSFGRGRRTEEGGEQVQENPQGQAEETQAQEQ